MPNSADLTSRLRRPGKLVSRSIKSTSSSSSSSQGVSAPPKAALSSRKAMNDDLVRHRESSKTARSNSKKEAGNKGTSTDGHNGPSPGTNLPVGAHLKKEGTGDGTSGVVCVADSSPEERLRHRISELQDALAESVGEKQRLYERQSELEEKERFYLSTIGELQDAGAGPPLPPRHPARSSQDIDDREERQWLQDRTTVLDHISHLQSQVRDFQDEIVERDGLWKSQWERDQVDRIAERNELAERLHAAEKEAAEKQKQLVELKTSMSSITRVDNQVSDNEIGEKMEMVCHQLREWLVRTYRRSKLDLSLAPENFRKRIFGNVETNSHEDVSGAMKLLILQRVVWLSFIEVFQDEEYFGLPDEGPLAAVRQMFAYFEQQSSKDQLDREAYTRWRITTCNLLMADRSEELATSTNTAITRIISQIEQDLALMIVENEKENGGVALTNDKAFESFVAGAVRISHLLQVQQSVYEVHLPQGEAQFNEELMEPFTEDSPGDSSFFAIAPAVVKRAGSDLKIVISKAKIVFR